MAILEQSRVDLVNKKFPESPEACDLDIVPYYRVGNFLQEIFLPFPGELGIPFSMLH